MNFFLKVRDYLFFHSAAAGLLDHLSDEKFVAAEYRRFMGEKINLEKPKKFSEKLCYLKIHDHNPLYTTLVDKYAVKRFLSERFGEEYIIPLLGVYDRFDDIDTEALPEQFVIKTTHDSGGVIICRDKSAFDFAAAKEKIEKRLKLNYYRMHREWQYKNIRPRIIVEKYIHDDDGSEPNDIKFYLFNGSVSFIEYDLNRKAGSRKYNINLYNKQWELLPFEDPDYPCLPDVRIEKPALLDEMIGYSKKLVRCAGDPDFLRVDLYTHNGGFLFGEMTFYDDAGYGRFDPPEYDMILGQELTIDTDRQAAAVPSDEMFCTRV